MTDLGRRKHALITQGFLYNIAGSETVAYEVAQYFSREGYAVTVATNGFNEMWAREFAALPRTKLFQADDPQLKAHLDATPPTLSWLQHQLIPESVLRNPPELVFFNQMSGAHSLEFPFSTAVVRSIGTLLTFNAEEILEIQQASGILDEIDHRRLAVFGNPAPDDFLASGPKVRGFRRLMFVSNHIPEEIVAAAGQLRDNYGVELHMIGLEASKLARPERISPEMLSQADAVVTIGKTVQYAIAARIPVYCYDKFGGPGWLDQANFSQARKFNFSGRSFSSKPVDLIVDEIVHGYERACFEADALHELFASSLTMSTVMPSLLRRASEIGSPTYALSESQIQGHLHAQSSIGSFVRIAAWNEQKVEGIEGESRKIKDRLRRIEASPSFKLAQKISRISHKVRLAQERLARGVRRR
ncbi:glycosyltransferase family protein [Homoserinimonas sp. A447]